MKQPSLLTVWIIQRGQVLAFFVSSRLCVKLFRTFLTPRRKGAKFRLNKLKHDVFLPFDSTYQFERLAYVVLDPINSKPGKLIFNRTITLKDTWTGKPPERQPFDPSNCINPKPQNPTLSDSPSAGMIACQAEGGAIDFRNIELTPLPTAKELNAPMPAPKKEGG
jgi:hypothetical protein